MGPAPGGGEGGADGGVEVDVGAGGVEVVVGAGGVESMGGKGAPDGAPVGAGEAPGLVVPVGVTTGTGGTEIGELSPEPAGRA